MTKRPLLIGDDLRAQIKDCIERAATQVTPLEEMIRLGQLAREQQMAWRPNVGLTVEIPVGYRVTYTHEEQRQCTCRHISISVVDAEPGYGPSVQAVSAILQEFGFVNPMHELPCWALDADGLLIVEFIEPLDGRVEQLKQQQRVH